MKQPNWELRYQSKETPWVHIEPVKGLLECVKKHLLPGRSILEVGCGFGVETMALAKIGYQLSAVDISQLAIEKAIAAASAVKLNIDFKACDILMENTNQQFDAILDIAVFPRYGLTGQQQLYINKIKSILKPAGLWLSMVFFNSEVTKIQQKTGVKSPPNIYKQDYQQWILESFKIIDQVDTSYWVSRTDKPIAFPATIFVLQAS